jgi:hypothetical protein
MSTDEIKAIKKSLDEYERRISSVENLEQKKSSELKKPLSVKEFILQKQPRGDVQKTLVLGYHLEHYRSISPFNVDDLEKLFREAKEAVPKNINDKVYLNIEKGFMMEAEGKKDKKKAWTLTVTGEKYVDNTLKKEK